MRKTKNKIVSYYLCPTSLPKYILFSLHFTNYHELPCTVGFKCNKYTWNISVSAFTIKSITWLLILLLFYHYSHDNPIIFNLLDTQVTITGTADTVP